MRCGPRADNLLQFIDRISNDLGATSAILRDRSEKYNKAGSIRALTTDFGSPMGSSTDITVFSAVHVPTFET
jgi:hypothetical protein